MKHSYAGYHFKGQHDNEHILGVIHRHWFNILVQFLIIIASVLVIVSGVILFQWTLSGTNSSLLDPTLGSFLVSTLILFMWFFSFFIWIDYWFDTWIITNERIVNIEQRGLFVREIAEVHLENIQDVTTEVSGFFPTIFDFGYVYVQTAGERERFVFEQVPAPYDIKNLVMQLSRESQEESSEHNP
jgi:uncharacterized membrane protein YdbT with pleckstrin-like domain